MCHGSAGVGETGTQSPGGRVDGGDVFPVVCGRKEGKGGRGRTRKSTIHIDPLGRSFIPQLVNSRVTASRLPLCYVRHSQSYSAYPRKRNPKEAKGSTDE